MWKLRPTILITLGIFIFLWLLFSLSRFTSINIATAADTPLEQKLERVLTNQDKIIRTLSELESEVKRIQRDLQIIKRNTD